MISIDIEKKLKACKKTLSRAALRALPAHPAPAKPRC
jgi:hypothetical protein